jgi:uncharacterized Zn finger protein
MEIRRKEVKTFVERAYCEACGTEMEMQPFVYTTDPPIYTYKCPKCGKIVESRETYPRTVHEDVVSSSKETWCPNIPSANEENDVMLY